MIDTPDLTPESVERFTSSFWASEMEAGAEMEPDPRGDWVRYSDYAALSASLEAKKATVKTLHDLDEISVETVQQLTTERDALKAELADAKMLLSHMVNHAEWRETNDGVFWEATDKARALLARHQKEAGDGLDE